MGPNWLDIVDDGDEDDDAPNPTRREGTFRVLSSAVTPAICRGFSRRSPRGRGSAPSTRSSTSR